MSNKDKEGKGKKNNTNHTISVVLAIFLPIFYGVLCAMAILHSGADQNSIKDKFGESFFIWVALATFIFTKIIGFFRGKAKTDNVMDCVLAGMIFFDLIALVSVCLEIISIDSSLSNTLSIALVVFVMVLGFSVIVYTHTSDLNKNKLVSDVISSVDGLTKCSTELKEEINVILLKNNKIMKLLSEIDVVVRSGSEDNNRLVEINKTILNSIKPMKLNNK
ncbi:hypothetical protein ABM033_18655 [Morganella morganii]|uniref:hypothetical protein n=1 Tax=Morganella morganii TaxID=582 RepID=UPI003EBBE752